MNTPTPPPEPTFKVSIRTSAERGRFRAGFHVTKTPQVVDVTQKQYDLLRSDPEILAEKTDAGGAGDASAPTAAQSTEPTSPATSPTDPSAASSTASPPPPTEPIETGGGGTSSRTRRER